MEAPVQKNYSWLADLPTEIVLEILNNLDRFQLNKLVRVNKRIQSLSQYILEHRKKIRLCGDHSRVLILSMPSKYELVNASHEISVSRSGALVHTFTEAPANNITNIVRVIKEKERWTSHAVTNGGKERTITLVEPPMAKNLRLKLYTLATTVDLCVLIVDPMEIDEFSEDIKEVIFGCCFMMSARNVVVTIDLSNCSSNEHHALYTHFSEAKTKISKLLDKTVGMCYTIIPINLRTGTNITPTVTPKYEWFSGASLKKLVLDDQLRTNFDQSSFNALCDAPLRLQLTSVYKVSGVGTVMEGRILSGKMKEYYDIIRIHPNNKVTETRGLESCCKKLEQGMPGNIVGVSVTMISVREVYPQFGYVVGYKETPVVNCTIAFRAQIAVMKPDRLALHQVYTVFYGSSRIPCILWWIFPGPDGKYHDKSERQFKIKEELPEKPRGKYESTKALHRAWRTYKGYVEQVAAENKTIMLEKGKKFERPPKPKLKKATAILLPLIHYDIETYKPTEFEKNYSGKLMIMENRKIVGVGRVDRVISNTAETFVVPTNVAPTKLIYEKQYAEVIDRAGSLFNLPKEQKLLEQFLDHVTSNERAKKCIFKYKPIHNNPWWHR